MAIFNPNQCDLSSSAALWRSPLGQRCQLAEQQTIAGWVPQLHGDTVLWVGDTQPPPEFFANTRVGQTIWVHRQDQERLDDRAQCCASVDQLPWQTRSIDAVVLQHGLEIAADPRIALREAARVLVPGGRLIISGFNPFSLLGSRALLARVRTDLLSHRTLVNPLRLFDWLTLLGLELDVPAVYIARSAFLNRHGRPLNLPKLVDQWVSRLPIGGVYAVSAVKRNASFNLPKHSRQPMPKLATVAYPRIASWQRQ